MQKVEPSFRKFGTIVLAYVFGLIIGTAGIFPKGSEGYRLALQGEAVTSKSRVLEALIAEGKLSLKMIMVNNIAGVQDNIIFISAVDCFSSFAFFIEH